MNCSLECIFARAAETQHKDFYRASPRRFLIEKRPKSRAQKLSSKKGGDQTGLDSLLIVRRRIMPRCSGDLLATPLRHYATFDSGSPATFASRPQPLQLGLTCVENVTELKIAPIQPRRIEGNGVDLLPSFPAMFCTHSVHQHSGKSGDE